MPLPLWHRCDVHGDGTDRIERDRSGRLCAILRPGLGALRRSQHGGDVAHVGDARLHDGRQTDAVEASFGARFRLPLAQLRETAVCDRSIERLRIIAGIEQRPCRGAIWKGISRHEIAPDHVDRIDFQFERDALHQPLERVIHLRTAEAAVQPRRRLVSQHYAVAHRNVADVVGAAEIAMHAIQRRWLGRAYMRADILDLVPGERAHAAIGVDRGIEPRDAIGRRYRRGEMLQPVFNPFHRLSGELCGDAHQYDVREDRLLHTEAAAGIRRRAQAQTIARHFERARHHRMQTERPLEIGEHVVGIVRRVVFGNDAIGFDRRA